MIRADLFLVDPSVGAFEPATAVTAWDLGFRDCKRYPLTGSPPSNDLGRVSMSDSILQCARCSAPVDAGDRFCARCGNALDIPGAIVTNRPSSGGGRPGGGSFRLDGDGVESPPTPSPSPPPPPQVPAIPPAARRRAVKPRAVVAPTSGLVEGQVRGLQTRTEPLNENLTLTVLAFQVERYDESGNRTQLVPVEMRGYEFRGSLRDGDWVRVHGKMSDGTMRSNRVDNRTTGATVVAKDVSKFAKGCGIIAFVAVCLFILAIILSVVFGG